MRDMDLFARQSDVPPAPKTGFRAFLVGSGYLTPGTLL